MTKAEIKRREEHIKLKVKAGDKVVIIAGKDKGQQGFIAQVFTKKERVIVLKDNPDNPDQAIPLNAAIKHQKAQQQGGRSARIVKPMPIHISNVMVLDGAGKPSRVGRRVEEGKLVRYAKKSNTTLPDPAKENKS
jgi:large subunit ribosomal protein L24